jgi:hypothetical protein
LRVLLDLVRLYVLICGVHTLNQRDTETTCFEVIGGTVEPFTNLMPYEQMDADFLLGNVLLDSSMMQSNDSMDKSAGLCKT